jgi:hypothetical protein
LFTVGGALVGFLVACIVVFARNRTHALRSDLSRESPLAKLIDAMSGAAIRP